MTIRSAARCIAGVVILCLACTGSATAGSDWVTASDLIDAILERRPFTPDQMKDLDLSLDGVVDAADLACFVRGCHRTASFAATATDVEESGGTVMVRVNMSFDFFGILNYTVSGTATSGVDFQPLSGQVAVSGRTVDIPVSVIDDTTQGEELETVRLSLAPGSGYTVGAIAQHTISIIENDDIWRGAIDSDGGLIGLQVRMIQSPSGYQAFLTSDGTGTFPAGEWPASITVTGTHFHLVVGPIDMPPDSTEWKVALQRSLILDADTVARPDDDHVDLRSASGVFQESLSSPSDPYLQRTITGRFGLERQLAKPSSFEPPLS